MKENFVRADGVSYREAVEKCIRHYVMRGYDLKGETERFERSAEPRPINTLIFWRGEQHNGYGGIGLFHLYGRAGGKSETGE